jgi:hypothetical protein
MNATRITEIEMELQAAIPHNNEYDPNAYPPLIECKVCDGAYDDHKAGCYVPLVYELLEAIKLTTTTKEHEG